jgi:hypothetical protein
MGAIVIDNQEKIRVLKLESQMFNAAAYNDLQSIKNIIESGFAPRTSSYALKVACLLGHIEIVKYLSGYVSIDNYSMNAAISKDHFDIVKYFVEDREYDLKTYGDMCLLEAACAGSMEIIKYFFEKGCDPERNCHRILIYATEKNRFEMFKYFVSLGYDPTKVKNDMVLINSIKYENMELIKYLIEDLNYDPRCGDGYVLVASAECSTLEFAKYFVGLGCNPRCQNDGAIIKIGHHGTVEFLEFFISLGCDPKCQDNEALVKSAFNHNKGIAQLLVGHGCSFNREQHKYLDESWFRDDYYAFMNIITNFTRLDKHAFVTNKRNARCDYVIETILQPEIKIRRIYEKYNPLRKILRPTSMHVQLCFI